MSEEQEKVPPNDLIGTERPKYMFDWGIKSPEDGLEQVADPLAVITEHILNAFPHRPEYTDLAPHLHSNLTGQTYNGHGVYLKINTAIQDWLRSRGDEMYFSMYLGMDLDLIDELVDNEEVRNDAYESARKAYDRFLDFEE